MVRGLDYYTRTTFELVTSDLGAQSAVGAGGRYDGLVKQLGGPDVPGIGFAMGMERLALLLEQQQKAPSAPRLDLFVVALGAAAQKKGFALTHALRKAGRTAAMDCQDRSLKNQMKQAGKAGARFAVILGEEELARGAAMLRNMESSQQSPLAIALDADTWARELAAKII
jgi:histidyl-tRNA synthetase